MGRWELMPRDVENDSFQIKAAKWASQRRNNIAQFPLSCCLSISLGFLGEGRSGQGRERQGGREKGGKWGGCKQATQVTESTSRNEKSPGTMKPCITPHATVCIKRTRNESQESSGDQRGQFRGWWRRQWCRNGFWWSHRNQFSGCCLVPAMGCSTRWNTFFFPSEFFATPRWPQGGDRQDALAGRLVFITEMKPVRWLRSASPAPHYRVRLCRCDHWMWLHLEVGALKSKWRTWREVMRPGPDPHMTGVLKRREFRHTGGVHRGES